jgi:predicted nucleic acid-binding protein
MTAWLLDINVLSEIRKRKPHRKVVAFVAGPSPSSRLPARSC